MRRTFAHPRLLRDERGISAVEFALITPLLLLLAMGVIETGRFVMLTLKVQHAATTLADLATRDETLPAATLTNLFAATRHILEPFELGADGVAILTGIGRENGGQPTVYWQRRGAGQAGRASAVGVVGGRASLPAELVLRNGETVVAAEVTALYRPWFLGILPETIVTRSAFYRPRFGALRELG